MDRHNVPGATAEDTANNHVADLEVAGQFGVEFFSYWHDSNEGVVICFARAPGEEAMVDAHAASHGGVPAEIIEVSESDVVRFLGKVHDPVDASEVTSAFRTICFTDLVGSTELLDRLGQSEYMVLLTEHDLIIRKALIRWNGREVKHTGDGFMVVFEDVDKALGWSLDVRESFGQRSDLDVRLGMAAGEPVDHDDDIFGAAVTMANRICSSAGPEQIHVSDVVRDLGVEQGFSFDGGKTEVLKGFSEPATIYELLGSA
jgi:class 3 adenylate cyclase